MSDAVPAPKDLTLQEVSEHNTKDDLYLILEDKIYNCSDFAQEHPPSETNEQAREEEESKDNKKTQFDLFTRFPSLHPTPDYIPEPANQSHSGGEEVLLDLAGQDCTEAFDDVGHSDEARMIFDDPKKIKFIGNVKRMPGDPTPKPKVTASVDSSSSASGFGVGLYAVILIGGAIAYGAYNYLQAQQAQQQ
ncbi:Cytochrome b5 [Penicillium griseofulvum]|uniref:Cytochrome b5 n=1 Tax=Penicillium patulum TaxID=5078 RepID=A0A135LH99_PENPA|nr:Cytochrome b5 [Penicillium griseofulvum]KXG48280.1 Cytochrome b5 [Penicillium griseofulvum]